MTFLYVGAYTQPPLGRARGIEVYRFDDGTGALDHIQTVEGIANPSFLAAGQDGRTLYAVCESEGGAVTAYRRDPETGELSELNRQSSEGNGPCYVSIDASGQYVLVANYASGSVAALPIAEDGSLEPASSAVQHEGASVNPDRQEGPHAHMIAPGPEGRHIFATDLGTDEIVAYTLDTESGQLKHDGSTAVHPGAGPRHFAFSPDGKTLYVLNELDSTLNVYAFDAGNEFLLARQRLSALPEGYDEESWCAHVLVSPDGRFVYGSNRGHDSIAIWAVDHESGDLAPLGHAPTHGSYPRNFTLDPSGAWMLVANQKGDTVVTMRRDADTGMLSEPVSTFDIPSAVALLFGESS